MSIVEDQADFEYYRYCVARDLCAGRDVLDVASGQGYGAALLSRVARSVSGIEIDARLLAHAETKYRSPNLRFLRGDPLALPVPDASVDVVVAFKTLGSLTDHQPFILEVRRVLRPSGLFLVGAPDLYCSAQVDSKRYYFLKLSNPELRSLLQAQFTHVSIFPQRPLLGALSRNYERHQSDSIKATNGHARGEYLLAVASDEAVPNTNLSAYLDCVDGQDENLRLQNLLADSYKTARDLGEEVFRLRGVLADSEKNTLQFGEDNARLRQQVSQLEVVQDILRETVLDAHNRIEDLGSAAIIQVDLARRKAAEDARSAILMAQNEARMAILQAQNEANARAATLQEIRGSTSWRITAPIRIMGRRFSRLAQAAREIVPRVSRHRAAWPQLVPPESPAMDPLSTDPVPPPSAKLESVARFNLLQSDAGNRLVFVAADIPPMFDRQSGALRLYTMMRILSEAGCRLAFASVAPRADFEALAGSALNRQRYESRLKEIGVEKIAYGCEETNALLKAEGNGIRWALLSFPRIAHNLIPRIRFHAPWATIIYDMVDFHFLRMNREANLKSDELIRSYALKFRDIELANARTSDVTIAVSEEERQAMLKLDPSVVVKVVSNIFEIPPDCDPELASRETLLFVGGFGHVPNIDAVQWFANEIWPLIHRQRPDLKFIIAGSAPTQEVLDLAKITNIEVVGYVEDLAPLFLRARVFVASLRYGAGVKGKVGQSMAQGVPIVATKVAAEGMNAVFGKDLLVADEPAAFAAAVTRLLDDDNLWLQLRANGKKLISQTQSIEAARIKLGNILNG